MKPSLIAMLNDVEQELVRDAEPSKLAELDEDALIELHTRVRRARTKYSKLYRRRSSERVSRDGTRGRASSTNAKTRHKAEIFEDVLARVSRQLAKVAAASAAEIKAERLAAARDEPTGHAAAGRTAGPGKGAGRSDASPRSKSPIKAKKDASTKAAGKRRQAKRDAR